MSGEIPEYAESFADVARAEAGWTGARRAAVGTVAPDAPLLGLALPGGGIRTLY